MGDYCTSVKMFSAEGSWGESITESPGLQSDYIIFIEKEALGKFGRHMALNLYVSTLPSARGDFWIANTGHTDPNLLNDMIDWCP